MSMLSAQCDELRELALWLDDEFYDAEATKVREAADTIWELRGMVHKERAENEKLRELVRDMWFGLYCPTEPTDSCPQCPFNREGECFFEQRLRELGIEVDDG